MCIRDRAVDFSLYRSVVLDEQTNTITLEYRTSLSLIHIFRRFDLIRWGDFVDKMNEQAVLAQSGNNWTQGGQAAPFFRVSSAYQYFPIPDAEKAVNKLITGNNPGW